MIVWDTKVFPLARLYILHMNKRNDILASCDDFKVAPIIGTIHAMLL
jgi:hypothetical protein